MERLKGMGLKRALFWITLWCLSGAAAACAALILGLGALQQAAAPSGVVLQMGEQPAVLQLPEVSRDRAALANLLGVLQIVLPAVVLAGSLLLAGGLFYRWKLKKPLERLQAGTEGIMAGDLDFALHTASADELGRLCSAFEAMRCALLESNRRLWRQAEDRQRLNAAFAHDLRNPVTVLKGCARLLEQGLEQGSLTAESAKPAVALMGQYARRVEGYVEAMTRAQRLEDLTCAPAPVEAACFAAALQHALTLLAQGAGKALSFTAAPLPAVLTLDRALFQEAAENLCANALRYARRAVRVSLTLENGLLALTVADDGPGFPPPVLERAGAPFLRGTEGCDGHFGMGLYLCRMLCEKHGGALTLENAGGGAVAQACFQISAS